jgi:hypothetical protein
MALVTTADVLARQQTSDGAGVNTYAWVVIPELTDLPARLDPVGTGSGVGTLVGEQINEESTHVVHIELPIGETLELDQRIDIDGDRWSITALRRVTEGIATIAEVRVA